MKRLVRTVFLAAVLIQLAIATYSPLREVQAQNQESSLVLYSANPPQLTDLVIAGFQQKYGIKVDLVRSPSAALFKRIEAESAAPLGDVFWSASKIVLNNWKQLFAPYTSPELQAYPQEYRDPDNIIQPCNIHIPIIMYNKNLVKEAEKPKSWKDLADPKWAAKSHTAPLP